ncbi:hypothetical protein MT418_002882 [Batrachochytrium dendrobatidis]
MDRDPPATAIPVHSNPLNGNSTKNTVSPSTAAFNSHHTRQSSLASQESANLYIQTPVGIGPPPITIASVTNGNSKTLHQQQFFPVQSHTVNGVVPGPVPPLPLSTDFGVVDMGDIYSPSAEFDSQHNPLNIFGSASAEIEPPMLPLSNSRSRRSSLFSTFSSPSKSHSRRASTNSMFAFTSQQSNIATEVVPVMIPSANPVSHGDETPTLEQSDPTTCRSLPTASHGFPPLTNPYMPNAAHRKSSQSNPDPFYTQSAIVADMDTDGAIHQDLTPLTSAITSALSSTALSQSANPTGILQYHQHSPSYQESNVQSATPHQPYGLFTLQPQNVLETIHSAPESNHAAQFYSADRQMTEMAVQSDNMFANHQYAAITPENYNTLPPMHPVDHPHAIKNYNLSNMHSLSARSVDKVDELVESLDMLVAVGQYGSPREPGGMFRLTPVESQLQTSYCWRIPNLHQTTAEKLVSPPFGPRDWSWQIVLYPKGTSDSKEAYSSAFIRPIKSDSEIVAKDNWFRPVTNFTFHLKYASAILHDSCYSNVPGNGEGLDSDFLCSQMSEPTFTGFSPTQSGWGFQEFYPLPFPMEAVDLTDGTATIQIDVCGPQAIQTSTIAYEYDVRYPFSTDSTQTENSHTSLPFGPRGCSWLVNIHLDENKNSYGNHISGYLKPIKSDFEESLGIQWSRSISTLTLELIHPVSRQVLVSKSITGGFVFSGDQDKVAAGWEKLWSLDQVFENLSGVDRFTVSVTVAWDPVGLSRSTTLGKVKAALGSVSESLSILKQDSANNHHLTEQLKNNLSIKVAELSDTSNRLKSVTDRLNIVQGRLAESQKELAQIHRTNTEVEALRERVELLLNELGETRESQSVCERQQVIISQARARLMTLRGSLEDISMSELTVSNQDGEMDSSVLHMRVIQMQGQIAELEYDLAQARATLNATVRKHVDDILSQPIQRSDAPEAPPLDLLQTAIDTALNETSLANATLDETTSKVSVLDSQTPKSERFAIVAEISMIQCGIDVAMASLLEASDKVVAHGLQLPENYATVYSDLEHVCRRLLQVRHDLSSDTYLEHLVPGNAVKDLATGIFVAPIANSIEQPQFDTTLSSVSAFPSDHPNYRPSLPLDMEPLDSTTMVSMRQTSPSGKRGLRQLPPPPMVGPPYTNSSAINQTQSIQHTSIYSESHHEPVGTVSNPKDLNAIHNRMNNIVDMLQDVLKTKKSGLFRSENMSRTSSSERSESDLDIELWTPINETNTAFDSEILASILRELSEKKTRRVNFWMFILSLLFTMFTMYSTVYIACDLSSGAAGAHIFKPYHTVCESTILPAWDSVTTMWHDATELVVLKAGPESLKRIRWYSRKSVVTGRKALFNARLWLDNTMRKAIERAPSMPDMSSNPAQQGADESLSGSHPIDHNVPKTESSLLPVHVDRLSTNQADSFVHETDTSVISGLEVEQSVEVSETHISESPENQVILDAYDGTSILSSQSTINPQKVSTFEPSPSSLLDLEQPSISHESVLKMETTEQFIPKSSKVLSESQSSLTTNLYTTPILPTDTDTLSSHYKADLENTELAASTLATPLDIPDEDEHEDEDEAKLDDSYHKPISHEKPFTILPIGDTQANIRDAPTNAKDHDVAADLTDDAFLDIHDAPANEIDHESDTYSHTTDEIKAEESHTRQSETDSNVLNKPDSFTQSHSPSLSPIVKEFAADADHSNTDRDVKDDEPRFKILPIGDMTSNIRDMDEESHIDMILSPDKDDISDADEEAMAEHVDEAEISDTRAEL